MTVTNTANTNPRVVSLIASATEILHALDAGGLQVARSHECDWPPAVLDLPQLTRTKFKVKGATSAEIDRSVKTLVEQGLAVYEVDAEGLQSMRPDVILTQDQCEVCAVSLRDVERALCTWTGTTAKVVSLKPHALGDVYADILTIASAIGRPIAGEDLVGTMKQKLDSVARQVAGRHTPSVAFIEWIEPPMSGGHWMPELTTIAGGVSLFGDTGSTSPWITWEAVAGSDPDVVIIAPCGYEIDQTLAEMPTLGANSLWSGLRAVREGRVFVADGNAFFNRPGPRVVETAEIMAEILHPEVCRFGHEGTGWQRFTA